MAASGCGRMGVKVGTWSILVIITQFYALCRDWKKVDAETVELKMEDRGHPVQECRCAGLLHG